MITVKLTASEVRTILLALKWAQFGDSGLTEAQIQKNWANSESIEAKLAPHRFNTET